MKQYRQNVNSAIYTIPTRIQRTPFPNNKHRGNDPPKVDRAKGRTVKNLYYIDSYGFRPIPCKGANKPRTK